MYRLNKKKQQTNKPNKTKIEDTFNVMTLNCSHLYIFIILLIQQCFESADIYTRILNKIVFNKIVHSTILNLKQSSKPGASC